MQAEVQGVLTGTVLHGGTEEKPVALEKARTGLPSCLISLYPKTRPYILMLRGGASLSAPPLADRPPSIVAFRQLCVDPDIPRDTSHPG